MINHRFKVVSVITELDAERSDSFSPYCTQIVELLFYLFDLGDILVVQTEERANRGCIVAMNHGWTMEIEPCDSFLDVVTVENRAFVFCNIFQERRRSTTKYSKA